MKTNTLYSNKKEDYFSHVRKDILSFLPKMVSMRLLDVGCGEGATSAYIKSENPGAWAAGIELNHDAAMKAIQVLDVVYEGDVENIISEIEIELLDCILCLDVLEHLINPWEIVKKLSLSLKPKGSIIISVPNVRSYKVFLPLIIKGDWRYAEDGIMDRGHLRFFTLKSAKELLCVNGFVVEKIKRVGPGAYWRRLINAFTFGRISDYLTDQYIISAIKNDK